MKKSTKDFTALVVYADVDTHTAYESLKKLSLLVMSNTTTRNVLTIVFIVRKNLLLFLDLSLVSLCSL